MGGEKRKAYGWEGGFWISDGASTSRASGILQGLLCYVHVGVLWHVGVISLWICTSMRVAKQWKCMPVTLVLTLGLLESILLKK
jgi:hypothetical protein